MRSTHEDRVAVVTGAARGIGQAICRRLAEGGADVVAVDLDEPVDTLAQLEPTGRKAIWVRADVSDQDETAHVGEEVRSRYGRCDILVNNAGIYPVADISELDYATWRKVLAVNLDSMFLMTQAVLPMMKEAGWGAHRQYDVQLDWSCSTGKDALRGQQDGRHRILARTCH